MRPHPPRVPLLLEKAEQQNAAGGTQQQDYASQLPLKSIWIIAGNGKLFAYACVYKGINKMCLLPIGESDVKGAAEAGAAATCLL